MDLRKVLFLGGDGLRLASVQVRCVDIARRLKCDYLLNKHYAYEIPDKYSAFVCVKPYLLPGELAELAKRGIVIWDIIDASPPKEHASLYLASTRITQEIFHSYGRTVVIPHHHCNFSSVPNPSNLRRPAWIGSSHWLPQLTGIKFDYYETNQMSQKLVVHALRKIGIALNFRNNRPCIFHPKQQKNMHRLHASINSGIKLINCLGFGTPSISADEPAYHEIGENCTIFTNIKKCASWVRALQNDNDLYSELRLRCLQKSEKYHLNAIAEKYIKLLNSLK